MNNNQFQQLDILSILSLLAQLSNMNKDENYHKIINQLFSAIDNEIKKLLPKYFCQQIELYKIDCFLYVVDNEKVITFLAYDTENGVIYFAIVK